MFNTTKTSPKTFIDSLNYWALLALAVILPVCTFFTSGVSPLITKAFLAGTLVLVGVVLFSISRMKRQELTVPKSFLLAAAWLIPVAYLLSTLFATDHLSFFGERLAIDSMAFMTVSVLALTVTVLTLDTQKRVLGVYLAMLASAAILTVLELIIFFGRDMVMAIGYALPSLSLIGSLNDLAVFFGLIILFALLSLILLPVSQVIRGALWLTIVAALFFLTIVNLTVLWWIIGLFALACFVYTVSASYLSGEKSSVTGNISIAALTVLIVSGVFLFAGDALTGATAHWANVGELDVRPSWQTTVSLGREALSGAALFGTGPGSFAEIWAQHMPDGINSTVFWQTDFSFGIGLIPTSIITTGIVGAAAWLVFLLLFLWSGLRTFLLARTAEQVDVTHYLRITSFIGALYLWIIAVIQVPSPALIIYTFLLTGVFIASQTFSGDTGKVFRLEFRNNPRAGFLTTLVLTITLLLAVGGTYGFATRFAAESSYQQAVRALSQSADVTAGESFALQAVQRHPTDVYYRLVSNIDLLYIRELLSENRPPEEIREQLQELLARAIANAQQATELDPTDYQNWVNLGGIYQSIVPLGIDGSSDSAIAAFDRALELRPASPVVYIAKATLERARGNNADARTYVENAIGLRQQYTDAIFLLAQMQLEENDVPNAIKSVETITIFEPGNPVAFFQLGLLRYGSDDFVGATQAFERAVALNEVYANARYFLGLSHWRLGNSAAALQQFERVQQTNPDNTEVTSIIENLNAGRDPFTSASASADIRELDGLPVEDADTADEAAVEQDTETFAE